MNMDNIALPEAAYVVISHMHKPRKRKTYYNNTVITVVFCTECKQELNRHIKNLNNETCTINTAEATSYNQTIS